MHLRRSRPAGAPCVACSPVGAVAMPAAARARRCADACQAAGLHRHAGRVERHRLYKCQTQWRDELFQRTAVGHASHDDARRRRRTPPRRRVAGGARAATPAGFPRVDADTQRERDDVRRKRVLTDELATEVRAARRSREVALTQRRARAAARREQTEPRSISTASRSCARRSTTHERNIEALNKELGSLKLAARAGPRAAVAARRPRDIANARRVLPPGAIARAARSRRVARVLARLRTDATRSPRDEDAALRGPRPACHRRAAAATRDRRDRLREPGRREPVRAVAQAARRPHARRSSSAMPARLEQRVRPGDPPAGRRTPSRRSSSAINGRLRLHLTCTVTPIDRRRRRCCSSSGTSTSRSRSRARSASSSSSRRTAS